MEQIGRLSFVAAGAFERSPDQCVFEVRDHPIHFDALVRDLDFARAERGSHLLNLFRQVCAAAHYAHESQVIHRDIKPGNILVTEDGTPKLLDFGIAKILNPDLTADMIESTVTSMLLMTPEYASPEQARGEQVTAATDQYSLGVLLYELLTGHRPYKLRSRAPHEIARIIGEEEPEKPSEVVTRAREKTASDGKRTIVLTPEEISLDRNTSPEELRRALTGGLDDVVMRTLRKSPRLRYGSTTREVKLVKGESFRWDGRSVKE